MSNPLTPAERAALRAEVARLREALTEISAQAPCSCGGALARRHLSSCRGDLGDLAREALKGVGDA